MTEKLTVATSEPTTDATRYGVMMFCPACFEQVTPEQNALVATNRTDGVTDAEYISTLEYEINRMVVRRSSVADLSLLVMRMARRLSKREGDTVRDAGDRALAKQAVSYLQSEQLISPMRQAFPESAEERFEAASKALAEANNTPRNLNESLSNG